MFIDTICADSFYASPPQAVPNCHKPHTDGVATKDPQYWNPNSERYETMQQLIERGRKERSIVFISFFTRLLRKIKPAEITHQDDNHH